LTSLQCQQTRFFQTDEGPKYAKKKNATMLYVLPKVGMLKKLPFYEIYELKIFEIPSTKWK